MTSAQASATLPEHVETTSRARALGAALVAPATMIVILAVSLLLLMTPIWTHFALDMSWLPADTRAPRLTCFPTAPSRSSCSARARSARSPRMRLAHMRDVRVVFWGFMVLAIASAGFIAWRVARHGQRGANVARHLARWARAGRGSCCRWESSPLVAFDVAFETVPPHPLSRAETSPSQPIAS